MKRNIARRTEAKIEVAAGAVQEKVGQVIGDQEMEAKGVAHQLIGNARNEVAKAAEQAQGVVEEVVGVAKNEAGRLLGDTSLQVEGKVEEIRGKVRKAMNK